MIGSTKGRANKAPQGPARKDNVHIKVDTEQHICEDKEKSRRISEKARMLGILIVEALSRWF